MSKLSKRAITLFVIATMVLSMLSAFIAVPVMAAVAITPANSNIDADTFTTVVYTDLPAIVIAETAIGEIGAGTIILNAPTGFEFRITSNPDVAVIGTTPELAATFTSITTTQLTITVTAASTSEADNVLTIGGVTAIGVIPLQGTPLITDDIVMDAASTSTIVGVTAGITSFGTLTMVPGALTLTVEGINDPFLSGTKSGVTVTALDQYDNIATGYTGTIAFTSSDGGVGVVLPTDYTFSGAGVKVFDGSTVGQIVTLITVGEQSVTATDKATSSITGSQTAITVYVDELPDFSIDFVTPGDVVYDQDLIVIGSGVTAGSEVIVYWDFATGTYVHPLNSTEGNNDGSYDLEVTVPSDLVGNHYLWVKDVATGATVKSDPITMIPKIKLSPSSGLFGDEITIKGYGFSDESEVTFTFDAVPLDTVPTTVETDENGYFQCKFDVPIAGYSIGDGYEVIALDGEGESDLVLFKIGASISITPDEGPTGIVVTVEGEGWTDTATMTFELDANPVKVVGDPIIVHGDKFTAEVVIPGMTSEGTYSLTAHESLTLPDASIDFEVTGIPEIVVTPTYGTPGSTITVTGYNFTQIDGTDVVIELWGKDPYSVVKKADLVTVETDSDGNFEDTFIAPAVAFVGYDVRAEDTIYHMYADDSFKVGLIALIINPVYGEAGSKLSITGIGFKDGDYNLTFGAELYEDYGSGVSSGEAISDIFYVPNVPTGIYDILITDEDDNEMAVEFRLTAVTEVTLDPAMAPNDYNVTIEGCNFADYEDYVDFVLYNATDEWDMDVRHGPPFEDGTPVDTCDDGNFTAWWEVLDEDTLSLGDYTINVTGYDDFFVQIPFSVVEARVSVAPRKALFDRGDTIQFNVKNDFDFPDSYMKIWDPYENLYWQTETFLNWVKAGDVYTVPYYLQTSGKNPMELSQDAPLGTWVYVFYEEGTTQLTNGTFEVGPSAESLLTDQIQALSEELGVDIDTLQTYIDAKIIDLDDTVSTMAANIATAVSGMESDISDLSDDLNTAVTGMQDDIDDMGTKMGSIETMMDDITETSGDAQAAANEAAASADAALDAAEANQKQTSGLTGLVYGAIGASLIAALAAIVSLMQISRRIAG